eukprot:gene5702-4065_t
MPAGPAAPAPPPCAVVVPGLPVIVDLVPLDDVRWTLLLDRAPGNFLVFLAGTTPIPDQCGVGVYVSLAGGGSEGFQFVGSLRPERPSGLFAVPVSMLPTSEHTAARPLVVGLSIESTDFLDSLGAVPEEAMQHAMATRIGLAERVLEEFCAFAASHSRQLKAFFFGVPCVGLGASEAAERDAFLRSLDETEEYAIMPSSFIDKWRERLLRRIQKDRTFLAA